jgi:hypothetical protein
MHNRTTAQPHNGIAMFCVAISLLMQTITLVIISFVIGGSAPGRAIAGIFLLGTAGLAWITVIEARSLSAFLRASCDASDGSLLDLCRDREVVPIRRTAWRPG